MRADHPERYLGFGLRTEEEVALMRQLGAALDTAETEALDDTDVAYLRARGWPQVVAVAGRLIALEREAPAHPAERGWLDRHGPAYRERLAADPVTALLVRVALGRYRWIADFVTPVPFREGEAQGGAEVHDERLWTACIRRWNGWAATGCRSTPAPSRPDN